LAPGELVIVLAIPVDKSGRQMLNTEVYASSSAVVNQGSWSVQIDTRVPPGASGLKFRAVILERCDHCDRSAPDQFDVPGSVPFPIPRGAFVGGRVVEARVVTREVLVAPGVQIDLDSLAWDLSTRWKNSSMMATEN
jgi:hypothetical protein